jgi:O-antigen/teichoic acid export membrane protein
MLIRHSFVYIASNLVAGVFGLVTAMVLTRLLSPASYGVYGLGMALIAFTSNMFFEWHGMAFVRFSEAHEDRSKTISTFLFLLVALLVVTALIFAIIYEGDFASTYRPVMLVGLAGAWATAWYQFTARVQIAALRPDLAFWMSLTRALVGFVASVFVADATGNAIYVLLAMAVGQIVGGSLFGLPGISAPHFDVSLARAVIRFGYPVALGMTVSGLTAVVSRFMLDWLGSIEAVGRFTAASFLAQNTLMFIGSGIGAAGHALALKSVQAGDHTFARRQLAYNFTLLISVLVPSAVGVSMIVRDLAPLLVGREFVGAVIEITPWMAVGTTIGSIRGFYFDLSFHYGHRTGRLVWVFATVAVLNAGFNFLLIPSYGELGAAMAFTFALAPSLIMASMMARHSYAMPVPLAAICQVALASVVMAGALMALSSFSGPAGLALRVVVGVVVYLAALISLDFVGLRAHALRVLRRQQAFDTSFGP